MATQKSARLGEFRRHYQKAHSELSQSLAGMESQLEREEAFDLMRAKIWDQMDAEEAEQPKP